MGALTLPSSECERQGGLVGEQHHHNHLATNDQPQPLLHPLHLLWPLPGAEALTRHLLVQPSRVCASHSHP